MKKSSIMSSFTSILLSLFTVLIVTGIANAGVLTVPSTQFPCDISPRQAPPAEDNCLQSAINAANPGDYILLQPNHTFVGPFLLRYKSGNSNKYITIATAAIFDGFPSEGHRVNPTHASLMPKIVAPGGNEKAFTTELKLVSGVARPAHHYALVGLEITQAGANYNTRLIKLGRYLDYDGSPDQDSLDKVAHHFTIDRCYIHKHPQGNVRNGIEIHSAHTNIVNSYISEIQDANSESHCIAGWNGPGPYKINNNHIEGGAINVLIGGAIPTIPNLIPSDIEFRHNTVRKPESWYQAEPHQFVKNLFELKNAQRVLIDRNIFENIWGDGQDGSAIVLTPKSENNETPWTTVEDVMFSNNIVRRAWGGVRITRGHQGIEQDPKRISIVNNLFTEIDPKIWCGDNCGDFDGKFIPVLNGSKDTVINHNTILQTGNIINAGEEINTGFIYTNNLVAHNEYGIKGAGASIGNGTLQLYFPNAEVKGNAIIKTTGITNWSTYYPANNVFPQDIDSTGLIDQSNGNLERRNYRLSPNSVYRNQADDGKDIGANIDAFNSASKTSDFDSDGKTDIAIFRPSNGVWYINKSSDDASRYYTFGLAGDIPTAADYDGDGQTDYAVFRPSSGQWYVLRSSDSQLASFRFGLSNDIPVPADYDGDGKVDYAVFRPSNGTWYVQGSVAGYSQIKFGTQGDKPMIGDYDGDGKSDYVVWRPSNGTWYFYRSFFRDYAVIQFGMNGDVPIQGDFDGDQRLDVGVWRPSTGIWYVKQSQSSSLIVNRFGLTGDTPILGDFDGDGKTDFSVWRSASGTWYSQQSSQGFTAMQYGTNGDIPASSSVLN